MGLEARLIKVDKRRFSLSNFVSGTTSAAAVNRLPYRLRMCGASYPSV
jgi:hypothetical protein